MVLDTDALLLSGPSGTVKISRGTFVLLAELLHRAGATVSIAHLASAIWPGDAPQPADALLGIRVRVGRVRRVLKAAGGDARIIRCVRGVGYRVDVDPRAIRTISPKAASARAALLNDHPELFAAMAGAMFLC